MPKEVTDNSATPPSGPRLWGQDKGLVLIHPEFDSCDSEIIRLFCPPEIVLLTDAEGGPPRRRKCP